MTDIPEKRQYPCDREAPKRTYPCDSAPAPRRFPLSEAGEEKPQGKGRRGGNSAMSLVIRERKRMTLRR